MAQIDDRALLPSERPSTSVPDAGIHLNIRPAAFGGAQAEATERLGGTMLQAGQHWGQIAVDDVANQFDTQSRKLIYGDTDKPIQNPDGTTTPDRGYLGLKGATALERRQEAEQQINKLRMDARSKLKSFDQQASFDRVAQGYQDRLSRQINQHADSQADVYALSVNHASIKNEAAKIAANPNNEEDFKHSVADMKNAAVKIAQLKGAQPGDPMWIEAENGAAAAAAEARIMSVGVTDPLRAMRMTEQYKNDLGPHYATVHAKFKGEAISAESDDLVASYMGGAAIPGEVRKFDPLIQQAAKQTGISPALGYGLISQESGGNPGAISSAGARGLTQLMPGTAKDLGVTNPHDPDQAVPAGFKYLKTQIDKYGSERAGLMAYNWGPGNYENWVKTGGDPDKIPQETRDFVRRVQGYAASYGSKMDVKAAQLDILNRPDLPVAVKASAYAKMEKQSAAVEAMKTAEIKTLKDAEEATTQAMMLSPKDYKKGTLTHIADRYEAVGDMSSAVNMRWMAAHEDDILTFATSPDSAQKRLLEAGFIGKAKALASGIIAVDEKSRGEAAKIARSELSGLKEAADAKMDMAAFEKKARGAVNFAAQANDPTLVGEIVDFFESHVKAQAAGQLPLPAQQQAITELRAKAQQSSQTNQDIKTADVAQKIVEQQKKAFSEDAYAAGTSIYKEVGNPISVNWSANPKSVAEALSAKADQARRISTLRGGATVLPFSVPELDQLRHAVDQGAPAQQSAILKAVASLPAEMIPHVGAALAGKKDVADPVSRGYAAAMSFYANPDPARKQVGDMILSGTQIRKNNGVSGTEFPVGDQTFQSRLQDKIGNAFVHIGDGKVPALIADAAISVYTHKMTRAGRQGEKGIDTGVLDDSLNAVVGKTIVNNGQTLLPPLGVDEYQFKGALRSLSDGDVDGFRTMNGSPVTAEKIARYGVLTNAGDKDGGEGRYFVEVQDPAQGGSLAYVQRPDGKPYILDINPLLERARLFPNYGTETPSSAVAVERRRAPASPTANVDPLAVEPGAPPSAPVPLLPPPGAPLPESQRLPVPGIGPRR